MKTTYISFHIHSYGIGFTKNILGAFYAGKLSWNKLESGFLKQKEIEEKAFITDKASNQILFDKIYYLHVDQSTFNKITATRQRKISEGLLQISKDEDMQENYDNWKKVLIEKQPDWNINDNELESEIAVIKTQNHLTQSALLSKYWKIIHYYNLEDQKKWLFYYSNSRNIYNEDNFEFINLEEKYNLKDLHDHMSIGRAMQNFLKDYEIIEQYDQVIINISNVGYEIQVIWFALAQAGWFSEKVKFIAAYDTKDQNIRFKDFGILEVSKKVLEEVTDQIKIYQSTPISRKRKISEVELAQYIGKGFSILILGERGIGKTRLIKEISDNRKVKYLSISAAAFDDDTKLESELFGYVKGAYTGANITTDGIFQKLHPGGILLIDEAHSMSKRVQEKLMSALSTDDTGLYEFKKLGGDQMEWARFTILFASNKSIDELKYQYLLPDFYDRVVQYVITIPPLREAKEDIELDWENTWNHQKFNTKIKCPKNTGLFEWLRTLDFPGNWRDLQRIAIWYEAFLNFDADHKKWIGFDDPLSYVKAQYERICRRNDENKDQSEFVFSDELTANGQVENYRQQLALWAKNVIGNGSFKKAANHFNSNGDSITEKTLYNWANQKKNT